jgi:hypothetical protein
MNLGILLEAKGHLVGAEAEFRTALALDPKHAAAHTCLAIILDSKDSIPGPGAGSGYDPRGGRPGAHEFGRPGAHANGFGPGAGYGHVPRGGRPGAFGPGAGYGHVSRGGLPGTFGPGAGYPRYGFGPGAGYGGHDLRGGRPGAYGPGAGFGHEPGHTGG